MPFGAQGLRDASTEHLRLVLKALYDGRLETPVNRERLANAGLLPIAERLDFLVGLGEEAVRASVVAALAERRDPRTGAFR